MNPSLRKRVTRCLLCGGYPMIGPPCWACEGLLYGSYIRFLCLGVVQYEDARPMRESRRQAARQLLAKRKQKKELQLV